MTKVQLKIQCIMKTRVRDTEENRCCQLKVHCVTFNVTILCRRRGCIYYSKEQETVSELGWERSPGVYRAEDDNSLNPNSP